MIKIMRISDTVTKKHFREKMNNLPRNMKIFSQCLKARISRIVNQP
jgi:hypothetical protein